MSDCNLHENQRKSGTLCRSMKCTKCPPYRGIKTIEQLEKEVQSIKAELKRESEKNKVLMESVNEALTIIAHACPDTYTVLQASEMTVTELLKTIKKCEEIDNDTEKRHHCNLSIQQAAAIATAKAIRELSSE